MTVFNERGERVQELVCNHIWSEWFDLGSGRWRMCSGLCHKTHKEEEPIPRVVLGRLE